MPTTIGQKRRSILEGLKAQQESSQGRIGVGQISEVEKLGRGLVRGITAPLDVAGLAVEPSYGPGGPGVAGTIGEFAGSIAPYLLAETALAKYVPLLRGRGLIPTATRAGASFGLVEFGRAPSADESRTANAMRGAIQGAIIGATSGGSIPKAIVGGAAATAVPLAMGGEAQSPVEITGNETADAVIFNAALAGAFQAVGRRLSADRPPPEFDESGTSTAPPPPPIVGGVPPVTDPRRLLSPRTFYQPPAPTEVPLDRRVRARAPVRTIIDEIKANIEENPLYHPSPEVMAVPEVASYFDRVTQLRSQTGMSAAIAQELDQARPSTAKPLAIPVQLVLPGIPKYLEKFQTLKIADEFVLPRVTKKPVAPIEPSKPAGPLVQLVRSSEEQADLEAKAAELKTSARVTAGRLIAVDEVTLQALPDGLPGLEKANGIINTTGLGVEEVDKLIDEAKIAGDSSLAITLGRTRAGLAGTGKKKGVIAPPVKRKTAAVASQVVEKARSVELSPEELLLRKEDESMYGDTPTLEAHVELAERRILEVESGDILPGEMAYKSKRFVGDLDRIKQGRSGDVYSYSNMLKAMKDMHTPIVGVEGDKFKVAMPDETLVALSKDEIIGRIEKALPPTDVVPVYQGPDSPPIAQPITRDSREWVQVNLPGTDIEARPIPEPSESVVLRSAERESVIPFPAKPKIAEYLETVERLDAMGIPYTSHAETGHSVKGKRAANPTDFVRKAKKAMGLPPDQPFERIVTEAGKAAEEFAKSQAPAAEAAKPLTPAEVEAFDRRINWLVEAYHNAPKGDSSRLDEIGLLNQSPLGQQISSMEQTGQIPLRDTRLRQVGLPKTEPPDPLKVATKTGKPTTVTLRPTKAGIDKFLEERGLVGTYERLPNRHKAAFVKGEAASKALEVDVSPQGAVVTDKVTGRKTRVKNLDEAARVVAENSNNEGPMRTADELRSFFRRRFAAAKTTAERNNIRKKYALYSEYHDQSPLRPGETPLDTLDRLINRRVPPVINLDPPSAGGAGRINLPPDPPPVIPGGGPTISDSIPFSELSGMGWRRYFEPMKFWALEIEKRSKNLIPAYTRVFAPLDEARQEMQVFLSNYYPDLVKAWKPFKGDAAARERIASYLEEPDKLKAIKELGISPLERRSADALRTMWNKLFKDLGYEDNLEFIENYVPWRRLNRELSERDAMEMFYRNRAKPRSYVVGHELERETSGEWVREKDAFKLFHDYLFRGARKRFVAEPHANAVKLVNEMPLPRDAESVRKHLVNFVDRMWGTTDASNKALNDFTDGLLQRLGVHTDKQFRTDVVSMLLQLNVGAHMAWRAPLAIRNMFQVFFVYPMVGERSFAYGFRHALTAEGKAEAIKAKIVGPEPVPFGDEIFNPFSTLTQVVRSGLRAYAKVDDFTRVVAYHATKDKVLRAAEMYRAKNWPIAKFIEEAELNSMFHPVEAKQIADIAKSGNIVGAAERAGYLMQENTNFIYRAGNSPEAFRGVAGRLFGQFGMWPVSYVEYIRYLSTFGTPNQRAGKIARFLAVNTAFGHAGTMLGVNTWKWLLFGPIVFTGGPMLQLAQDAGKVVSATVQGRLDEDPEAAQAAARLKRNVPSTFIPGSGFLKDVEATLEEARYGAQPAITRMLLGQSPQAQFSALPPKARRRAIVERLRSAPPKPAAR